MGNSSHQDRRRLTDDTTPEIDGGQRLLAGSNSTKRKITSPMLLIPYILSLNYRLTLNYRFYHIRIGGGSRGALGLVGDEEMEFGYDGSISRDGRI